MGLAPPYASEDVKAAYLIKAKEAHLQLEAFQQLEHLDLSRTPISKEALWIVDSILDLESIDISGTSIGWWTRRKVRSVMQRRQLAKPVTPFRVDS